MKKVIHDQITVASSRLNKYNISSLQNSSGPFIGYGFTRANYFITELVLGPNVLSFGNAELNYQFLKNNNHDSIQFFNPS